MVVPFNEQHVARQKIPHHHQFYELMFLEKGGGEHRLGNRSVSTQDGDLYLIPPGEVHDITDMTNARGWVVVFEADALELPNQNLRVHLPGELLLLSFLRPPGTPSGHLRIPLEAQIKWTMRIQDLRAELRDEKLGYLDAAQWHLNLLLLEAARLAASQLDVSASAHPLLERVFRVIEARYREPISLADVAHAVGRSSAYLTHLVRLETGRTVLEWLIERRLAEARRLLTETNLSLERVAELSGFSDASYFGRRFRKSHGAPPNAWRRAQRSTSVQSGT